MFPHFLLQVPDQCVKGGRADTVDVNGPRSEEKVDRGDLDLCAVYCFSHVISDGVLMCTQPTNNPVSLFLLSEVDCIGPAVCKSQKTLIIVF